MGIGEGEEMQANRICNIFNKIIAENVLHLKEELSIKELEVSRPPNRVKKNRPSPQHIIFKQLTQRKEKEYRRV
jgi:hypothetical protein